MSGPSETPTGANAIDRAVAANAKRLRKAAGMTLDELATASGVSRAMISRIERGEASPTAALLGRLCAGLGVGLGAIFAEESRPASPIVRDEERAAWRDPATGYVRRAITPPAWNAAFEMVEVEFPPGERMTFDPWRQRGIEQQVFVLDGVLRLTVADAVHDLGPGDAMWMRLDGPITFACPGPGPARYLVAVAVTEARKP